MSQLICGARKYGEKQEWVCVNQPWHKGEHLFKLEPAEMSKDTMTAKQIDELILEAAKKVLDRF